MADVIQIRERLHRNSRKAMMDPPMQQNAVIILFTGIRYERLEDKVAPVADQVLQGTTRTH